MLDDVLSELDETGFSKNIALKGLHRIFLTTTNRDYADSLRKFYSEKRNFQWFKIENRGNRKMKNIDTRSRFNKTVSLKMNSIHSWIISGLDAKSQELKILDVWRIVSENHCEYSTLLS